MNQIIHAGISPSQLILRHTSLRRAHEGFTAAQGLTKRLAVHGGVHGQPGSLANKLKVIFCLFFTLSIVKLLIHSTIWFNATEREAKIKRVELQRS